MIKISIVTAVLNGEKYIRDTVESVLNQKGDFELEYIIRDGCSTDDTLKILEEYSDRCTIVSKKDGSPQEAINAGMDMASGEIGAWLNADDLYLPGTLQKVVDTFQTKHKLQWCYGRCRIINENNIEVRKPVTLYKNLLGFIYSRNVLLCENFINQPATFWKMDLWRKVSELSGKFKAAWDYELWLEMSKHSRAIAIHEYFAEFRRHSESISENNFEKQFKEELNISKCYGNKIHYLIHKFNFWKIVTIYKLLK